MVVLDISIVEGKERAITTKIGEGTNRLVIQQDIDIGLKATAWI